MVTYVVYAVIVHATNAQATWNSNHTIAYTGPIRRISYLGKYGGVEQAALRTGRSPNGGSKLSFFTRNNDDFAEPACSTAPYYAQDAYEMCQNDLFIRNQGPHARHIYQRYVTYQYCPIYSMSEHHGGS